MNISIFGLGYVGCVSLGCLAKNGHSVTGVDVSRTKVDQINSGKPTIIEKDIEEIIREQHELERISATMDPLQAVHNSEISIVAVGTPTTPKGHLNLNYIFNVARDMGAAIKTKNDFHIIAIRSTIMPGTCKKFGEIVEEESGKILNQDFTVLSNPEFLREGSAVQDYFNPPLTLIGSDHPAAAGKMAELYQELPAEVVITDIEVAEIMKYVNNTYHALKISFANEIGNICKAVGIDSYKVMDLFVKDKQLNISPYYFKPGFAYGGSCLPKDLKGLQMLAHDNYIKIPVIESIDKTNLLQIERAVEFLAPYRNKRIGILGLSFKAGTDDLRNSPGVTLVEVLLGKGFHISIFDKNIQLSRLTGTNKEFIDGRIPHLANLMVQTSAELAALAEVIIVSTKEKEFTDLLKHVEGKTIIDLVHLDDQDIQNKDNYFGINW